jgi:hypothetical protein
MPDCAFEHTIHFYEVPTPNGPVAFPLITITLVQPSGTRVDLPLLFDTGASVTTLRDDLYPVLGVPSWDSGVLLQSETAGGVNPVPCYRYDATLELFGKAVNCPVHLMRLPKNPLYVGLFGRAQIFDVFGFGFWESSRELYVTLTP